jgi:catechol 2,3-dioxygenase-like lactoylglutathione lyase family enzyme
MDHFGMKYQAPTPEDLQRLKDELGLKSHEMAELFGLSSGRHWRYYTGETDKPRTMSAATLFFGLARLTLSDADIERVTELMRKAGATVDLSPDTGEPD